MIKLEVERKEIFMAWICLKEFLGLNKASIDMNKGAFIERSDVVSVCQIMEKFAVAIDEYDKNKREKKNVLEI